MTHKRNIAYFTSSIFGAVLTTFCIFPSLANAQEFFFHWGDVHGNQELLSIGGYPADRNPADRLGSGEPAQLNEPLFEQIRRWYIDADRRDNAGPGFYISDRLTDSRKFGSDLLIVEVEPIGSTLSRDSIITQADFRMTTRADRALDTHDFSGLPVIANFSGSYHVIYRPPTQDEATHLRITFHPPTAEDVDRLWKSVTEKTSPENVLTFLANLGREIQNNLMRKENTRTSRRAEILIHRLFFDRGFEFLTSQASSHLISNANFQDILKAYHRALPRDPRTLELTRRWLTAVRNRRTPIEATKDTTQLLADVFLLLPENERLAQARPLLRALHSHDFGFRHHLEACLQMLDSLPSDTQPSLRKTWIADIRRSIHTGDFKIQDVQRAWPLLLKDLGKETAIQAITGNYRASLLSYATSKSTEYYHHGPIPLIKTTLETLRLLESEAPAQLQELIDQPAMHAALHEPEPKFRFVALYPILEFTSEARDPHIRQTLIELVNKHLIAHLDPDVPDQSFQDVFYYLLAAGWPPYKIEATIRHVLSNFPDLLFPIWRTLEDLAETPPPIAWAQLLEETRRIIRTKGVQTEIALRYRRACRNISPLELDLIDPDINRGAMERTLENIAGSRAYSELSRIFALVDPALLSDDIRVMNAARPQHRLDEQLVKNGHTVTKPIWQNFTNLWESFGTRLWLRRQAMDRQLPPSISIAEDFPPSIILADAELLTTFINGVPQPTTLYPNWDRTSQTTVLSHNEWNLLALDRSRDELQAFFTIEESPASVTLKLRSKPDALMNPPSSASIDEDVIRQLVSYLDSQITPVKDPIRRAAKILHLVTKLQPFQNASDRIARLWAALELVQAGHSMPVGLPTHAALMSERHLELEIRKAVRLGRFWEEMIQDAQAKGISPDDFFQKVFRGSALEGLIHIDPINTADLERHVEWLEAIDSPPAWAKELTTKIEAELERLRRKNGSIAQTRDVERVIAIDTLWKEFTANRALEIAPSQRRRTPSQDPSIEKDVCKRLLPTI